MSLYYYTTILLLFKISENITKWQDMLLIRKPPIMGF